MTSRPFATPWGKSYNRCKEHKKPYTVKWGIASSSAWCYQCKKFIPHQIDWSGHP